MQRKAVTIIVGKSCYEVFEVCVCGLNDRLDVIVGKSCYEVIEVCVRGLND